MSKSGPYPSFFDILTLKCASRYSGVRFFNISTSKNGPLKCAARYSNVQFFSHRNFKKWSAHDMFCTFCLENVLFATTACNFFHVATSKSGPPMTCFVHFDLKMCFSLQRRAIFLVSSVKLPPHPPL